MNQKRKKAFTMTEMVAVLAIIAILVAVLVPTFSLAIASAKETGAKENCLSVYDQCRSYLLLDGTDEQLNELDTYVFVCNGYAFKVENGQMKESDSFDETSYKAIADDEKIEGINYGNVILYKPADVTTSP